MIHLCPKFYFRLKLTPLIFLLFFQFSLGQNTAIDSLNNLLSNETIVTQKFPLLEQIVTIASNTDLKKALVYARQAVKLNSTK